MVKQDVTGTTRLQNHMRRKKVHDLPLANPDVYEAAAQVRSPVLHLTWSLYAADLLQTCMHCPTLNTQHQPLAMAGSQK